MFVEASLRLFNGYIGSCCRYIHNKADYNKVQENPDLLINPEELIDNKNKLLDGQRVHACFDCWEKEDLSVESYRLIKNKHYSDHKFNINEEDPFKTKIARLELAFDNTCNFKCLYCTPEASSKWADEIERFGEFNTSNHFNSLSDLKEKDLLPIPQKDYNPFIEAFWKKWPELYREVKSITVTGGEPMLSKRLWRLLDELLEGDRTDINLVIPSNLSVESKLIDRFIERLDLLSRKINKITIAASIDTHGRQAEYIRYGLDYRQFWLNCEQIATKAPLVNIDFFGTVTCLSVPNLINLIKDIEIFKNKFSSNNITLDLNLLYAPKFLQTSVLGTEQTLPILYEFKEYIHQSEFNYLDSKVLNIIKSVINKPSDIDLMRKDFGIYVNEIDRRRNSDFRVVFPELKYLLDESDRLKNIIPIIHAKK